MPLMIRECPGKFSQFSEGIIDHTADAFQFGSHGRHFIFVLQFLSIDRCQGKLLCDTIMDLLPDKLHGLFLGRYPGIEQINPVLFLYPLFFFFMDHSSSPVLKNKCQDPDNKYEQDNTGEHYEYRYFGLPHIKATVNKMYIK